MPVTFDNAAAGGTAGTSLQFNLTAAANTVLVVAVSNVLGRSASAIAYAGVALTKLGQVPTGTELWALTAPASGSNVLSAQFTNVAGGWVMIGLTYLNVKASGGFGAVGSATATAATNFNMSISATANAAVIGFFRANSSAAITANNGTTRAGITATDAGGNVYFLAVEGTGAATVSLSCTYATNTNWQTVSIPLYYSAVAATTARFSRALVGVGR